MLVQKARRSKKTSDLEQVAQSFEPKIAAIWKQIVEDLKGSVVLTQLENSIRNGNYVEIDQWVTDNLNDIRLQPLKDIIVDNLKAGAEKAREQLPSNIGGQISFDLLNPKTVDYINQYTGDLITRITEQQKESIREIVESAAIDGINPRVTALKIRDVGIGLDGPRQKALLNYEGKLLERGLSKDQVKSGVSRYYSELMRQRTETIARNESITAAKSGVQEQWAQAKDAGLIDDTARKFWVTAGDSRVSKTCRSIASMNADGVPVNSPFQSPNGDVWTQGHIQCRCSVVLRFE